MIKNSPTEKIDESFSKLEKPKTDTKQKMQLSAGRKRKKGCC